MRRKNLSHNPEVAGSNPVSAIKKRDTRENLVSFFYALRPTGSRGCSTDRCRWQKKEGDAGEKSGVPQTERREGGRTTRFRGGQGRFKSCLRNQKERYKRKSCIFFLCPATEKAVLHTDWAQVRQNKARRKYGIRPFITISAKQERSSLLFMLKSNKNPGPVS